MLDDLNRHSPERQKQKSKIQSQVLENPASQFLAQAPEVTGLWTSSYSPTARSESASADRPRSALKIRLEILETVRDHGASKSTKIMHTANLSHARFVRYLEELVSKGLLRENLDDKGKSYALTAVGLDFVRQVKEAETFVAAFGLTL
jgi:predicted transcriptional regulator